ncbi:TPA: xylulokinase [Candidatus Bathyarchaeota archaeon]|nr:xylulokinase [Candidatus Bathyarchaeota archaeon]
MSKSIYFIGIDNGTQSTKTVVVDGETGAVIGKASESYGLIKGLPPGYKEQHPHVWVKALKKTVRKAIKLARINPKDVKAIGVSGQQHGLVPLDENGNVIRPAKLWNDTSTIKECQYIIKRLGGKKAVIKLIGNNIPPGFTASKILWLKRHEPNNYRRLRTILLPHDYLNYYLTGNIVMEYGDASGTALMDIKTRSWCQKVIDVIDPSLKDKLPPLRPSNLPVGNLRSEVAKELSLKEDVLVSAGGGDNMMSAIGTGNTSEGIVTASLGTSGTIFAYSKSPIIDPNGELAAFCDSTNAWLPLLCTMNVTVATEMMRNLFGLSHDQMTNLAKNVPSGSEGLILLPYFEGERTPNVPEGTGVIFGLNSKTFTKAHLIRAAMEGATLGMNYGLNRMRELGIKPAEIRLTGGGSKNRVWRQIAADIFNVEVVCLQVDEGAAYGAALQSYWTYMNYQGENVTIQEVTNRFVKLKEDTRTKPNPENVKKYIRLQSIHNKISLRLRGLFRSHRRYLNEYT